VGIIKDDPAIALGGQVAQTSAHNVVELESAVGLNVSQPQGGELAWEELGRLETREVGEVLERAVRRIDKHLRRHGLLDSNDRDAEDESAEDKLAASAVSGQVPPAGPQWLRGLSQPRAAPLGYDKPLCASLDGFTLHAATRAGALHPAGREALLRYVLRPPIAQHRLERGAGELVRITLKRAYADGTVAVELDPLSLLCRLATSVPPPRFHTVKYAGVLASASPWRPRIAPPRKPPPSAAETQDAELSAKHACRYRPWAELLKRTFDIDVLECPKCHGRMKLLAMITDGASVARYLTKLGEPTDVPGRSPSRGPPYWKSRVLRLKSYAPGQE
jgi:hypothetical protein